MAGSSDKLYEAGLDEQQALEAMGKHVGQLLAWAETYVPPLRDQSTTLGRNVGTGRKVAAAPVMALGRAGPVYAAAAGGARGSGGGSGSGGGRVGRSAG